ncbi:MAG: serine/threonine-protein kinase [Planctomycetota bacterium]|jgi:predicted Ser/Thr protein kinase
MEDQERDEAFHFAGDHLGKFVVLGELGRGSMGVVYEAFQEDLKRKVALKVLPANIALDIKQVRRFRREAESVARLHHPNVIQIFEVGQLENTHYFAMELVDGSPFGSKSFIRDRSFVDEAARITRDAARGLAHAHEKGVIHRDMKPGNLLVDKAGRVVVTDFGLARLSESTSLTSTDAIVGTPKYMAPEQILPGTYPLDGRCDVYGLGATLYEAVCGNPPIDAPSVQAFLRAILEERPVWPRKKNRLIPHDLCTIIMRCLEKHPGERYKSAEELADDLDRFLNGERIQAKPKGMAKRALAFVARHKIVAALSSIALVATILAFTLTRELGTTKKTSDLRAEILRLQEQDAIVDLEQLAKRHPGNREVANALASEREELALELLDAPRKEAEARFPEILALLEKARQEESFWHLMLLFECDRPGIAKTLLAAGKLQETWARLVRARLLLIDGEFEKARDELATDPPATAPPEEQVFHYLVRGRAHRALKEDAEREASIRKARSIGVQLSQGWLQHRVEMAFADVLDMQQGTATLETLRNIFRNVQDLTAALLGNLSQIAENLTAEERRSVEAFIERVLAIAEEPATTASELVEKGKQRVSAAANDSRAEVLGHLLQAIGKLAAGDIPAARAALLAADDLDVRELAPYVYWAYSLAARADRDTEQALLETGQAIDFASRTKFTPTDWKLLGQHARLLLVQATPTQRDEFAKTVYEPLPEFVRDILAKFINAPASPEAGPD